MEALRQLAAFVQELRLEDLPQDVRDAARYCVLDTLGSALGAAENEELAAIAREYAQWTGLGENNRSARLWGSAQRTNLMNAVFLNGMMAHQLELDDVHTASKSHVGAVVVPAAWAVAEALGCSGKTFLEAVVAGYEVMGRVGKAMDVASNRKRGWHTTGIIGTFGAAAAACKLFGLTQEQTANALGLAGTQSCGLWAFLAEGATCKKLHTGRAAVNGVASCLLAKSGMTGAIHILDAKDGGLYPAVSDSWDMEKLTEGLGQSYEITRMDKKPYPCCRTTHPNIDAALRLRAEGVRAQDVAQVLVETYEVGVLQCGFSKYPESPVEAKFSTPFTVACALVKGHVNQADFDEQTLQDAQIRRIAEHTSVVAAPLFTERYPKQWGSRMTITCTDGSRRVCQIDNMSGSVAVPLSPEQEQSKFLGLAAACMDLPQAQRLMEEVLRIEQEQTLPQVGM